MFALWYIYLGWEEYRRVQGIQWNLPSLQRWTSKQKQSSPQPTNGKQTTPKASPPSTPILKTTKQTPPIDKNTLAKVTPSPPSPTVPAKTPITPPQNIQPSPTKDQPIPKPPPPPVPPPKPSPQQPIPQSRSKFEPDPQLSPESRIFQSTKISDDPPSKISPIMLDTPQAPKPPTTIFPDPSKFSAAPDFQPLTKSTPKQDERFNNFGRQSSKQKPNENQSGNFDERVFGKTEQTTESLNSCVENEVKSTENMKIVYQDDSDLIANTDGNIVETIASQSEKLSDSVNAPSEKAVESIENTNISLPELVANVEEQAGNIYEMISNQAEQPSESVNPLAENEVKSIENTNISHPELVANVEEQAGNIYEMISNQSEQPSESVNPLAENEVKSIENTNISHPEFVANIDGQVKNIDERIGRHTEQPSDFVDSPVVNGPNSKFVHLEDSKIDVEEGESGAATNQYESLPIETSSERLTRSNAMEVSFGNSEEIEHSSEETADRATVTYFDSTTSNDGGIFLWNELEDNARFIDSASETFSKMSVKSTLSADSILRGSDEVMTAGKQRVCKKASWPRRVSISDDPPAVYLTETTTTSLSADQLPSEEQVPFDVKMRRELELTAAVLREDWLRKKQMSTDNEKQSQSDEEMALIHENDDEDKENASKVADNEKSDTCQTK